MRITAGAAGATTIHHAAITFNLVHMHEQSTGDTQFLLLQHVDHSSTINQSGMSPSAEQPSMPLSWKQTAGIMGFYQDTSSQMNEFVARLDIKCKVQGHNDRSLFPGDSKTRRHKYKEGSWQIQAKAETNVVSRSYLYM